MEEAASAEEELRKRLDIISGKAKEIASETRINQTESNKQVAISSMTWQQVADAMEKTEKSLKNTTDPKKIKALKSYNDQLKERKKVLEAQTGLGSQSKTKKKTAVADPKTYEELSANIEIYKKKLTGADTEEQRIIRKKILRWEEALRR